MYDALPLLQMPQTRSGKLEYVAWPVIIRQLEMHWNTGACTRASMQVCRRRRYCCCYCYCCCCSQ